MNKSLPKNNLRQTAHQIIQAALRAVDPAVAVHQYFNTHSQVARQICRQRPISQRCHSSEQALLKNCRRESQIQAKCSRYQDFIR